MSSPARASATRSGSVTGVAASITLAWSNDNAGGKATKYLKKLQRSLGAGKSLAVGFLESETYPGGTYHFSKKRLAGMSPEAREFAEFLEGKEKFSGAVAQVAFWNEFGTKTSPARPFMRFTVSTKSPNWGKQLGEALIHTKYDVEAALALMGEGIQGQLRETITAWRDPPNSGVTAALKGKNKPLIDSGQMLRAVDFQVLDEA
jgi:hypothetical protein